MKRELGAPPSGIARWLITSIKGTVVSDGHTAYEAHSNGGQLPPFGECEVRRLGESFSPEVVQEATKTFDARLDRLFPPKEKPTLSIEHIREAVKEFQDNNLPPHEDGYFRLFCGSMPNFEGINLYETNEPWEQETIESFGRKYELVAIIEGLVKLFVRKKQAQNTGWVFTTGEK